MLRKITLWLLWISFIIYVFWFAPPVQADTFQPLQTLLAGKIPYVNPVILSLFSMIGIWLLIYSCLIFADGRMQQVRAWIFMLASVGTGVVGLIPYLALRDSNQSFTGRKDAWIKLMDARSTGIILTVSTIVLFGFALLFGDWSAYFHEFQTNKFIHAMSLAFCLFAVLFPTLLGDDMARRGMQDSRLFWTVALLPLVGSLAYLCFRQPLPDRQMARSKVFA
ncbi:MAG TPA: hypothetical protein V6D10_00135 [Trichocoleus sp.]|jgi:hypothetical protein